MLRTDIYFQLRQSADKLRKGSETPQSLAYFLVGIIAACRLESDPRVSKLFDVCLELELLPSHKGISPEDAKRLRQELQSSIAATESQAVEASSTEA